MLSSSLELAGRRTLRDARIALAFAAIYFVWGSTYLAIRVALDSFPPLLMAGARNLLAGAVLYAWARRRGALAPTREQWRWAALLGALLFVGGAGSLAWAEQRVSSGLAALMFATIPLWAVVLEAARPGGVRPGWTTLGGVALGLAGVGALVGVGTGATGGRVDPLSALVLQLGALAWVAGSRPAGGLRLPHSPALLAAMEMLAGGALLVAAGLLVGESAALAARRISMLPVAALGYLTVFGSLVSFTAYTWLLGAVPAARVATYAFVNPVVAVALGWALAGEPVGSRTLGAGVAIVAAVALIVSERAAHSATAGLQPEAGRCAS